MKAKISEEGIMEIKALVMSKSTFKQLREVRQKELESIEVHIIGYVNNPEGLGMTWLIAQDGETIIRVMESEYWWIFRLAMPHANIKEIASALADKIHSYQQIFLK